MSENVTISLIGAFTTVVVSALNLGFSFAGNRRGKRNEANIQALKHQSNGIQEKLEDAAFARGVKHGEAGA